MSNKKQYKFKLIILNFLEFAVWGSYLTCMGAYLGKMGMGPQIGWFYAVQGIVSLFMPALIGIIADKWIPAQKVLAFCHLIAAIFMIAAGVYGIQSGADVQFGTLFTLYTISVAFFMPTIAMDNSVCYTTIANHGEDEQIVFPPIRVFGTIGFIFSMVLVDLIGFQATPYQFVLSGGLGILMFIVSLLQENCPVSKIQQSQTISKRLGLDAFKLFKEKKMAIFFIFSMLLGVSLQITNAYANPFINHFADISKYTNTFAVNHANIIISISQLSETLCILLIPFFLKRYGIKKVMLIAMIAWVFRFVLFGLGNPGPGVWMFILSMIVYGIAFDFFNISGSLFVNQEVDSSIQSSAQGLFMLMTNGLGATIGTLSAQAVVNHFVYNSATPNWSSAWYVFSAYALLVAVLFAILFKYKHLPIPAKK
ncbi:MAG: MFS transporter [Bacteroidales bacterium]